MRTVTWFFPLCVVALVFLLFFAGTPSAPRSPAATYRLESLRASPARWNPSYSVVQQGTSIVFSQIGDGAFGNRFLQTTLILSNNTPHQTSGTIEFLSDTGSPWEVEIDGTRNSAFSFQISAGGMQRFVTSGTGDLKVGWVHVHSQQPIAGMASFGIRDAQGTIYTDVGVAVSEPGTAFTLFADMIGESRTGLAVANPSAESIVLRLTLLRANGQEVAFTDLALGPWGHAASFLDELFSGVAGIGEFEGSVTVVSEAPFCGLTLRQTGDQLTSMPMVSPPPEGISWTKIAFPHVGDGSGAGLKIQTSVILINNTDQPATGSVEFVASDGTPLQLRAGGVEGTAFNVSLPPFGVQRLRTEGSGGLKTGWARVTVDQSIRGVALFEIRDAAGVLVSEVGVESPFLRETFRLIADSLDIFNTGIALVNPDEAEGASLTANIQLISAHGNTVSSKQVTLGMQEHSALFFTELFNDVPNIEEFEGTLRISANEYVAALCLRQAGVKLTSGPLLSSNHGFAPRTSVGLAQNLKGHSPPFSLDLIQNSDDFALQRLTLSSTRLAFDTSRFPAGSTIAYGYFAGGNNSRSFELIAAEAEERGFLMQSFDGEDTLVQGNGTFSEAAGGGMKMDLIFSRKLPYSVVAGNLTLHFVFREGLLEGDPGANSLEFTAEYESVSIKPDRDERILLRQNLSLVMASEDTTKPALLAVSPLFVQPGSQVTLSGSRFGSAPLLSARNWEGREVLAPVYPGEGDAWHAILPPGLASGSLQLVDGTQRSNPYWVEVLYAPAFSLARNGDPDQLEIRWVQARSQFPVARFEVEIARLEAELSQLAVGEPMGQGVLWVGDRENVQFIVRSAGEAEAVADVVESGGEEVLGELRLSKPGSGGLVVAFTPALVAETPYLSSGNQSGELLMTALPVTWPAPDTAIPFAVNSVSCPTSSGGDVTALKAVQSDAFRSELPGD